MDLKRHFHVNGTYRFCIMCRWYTNIKILHTLLLLYSNSLQAGWSRDRVPAVAKFSTPIQNSPGAQPASYTMGTTFLSHG